MRTLWLLATAIGLLPSLDCLAQGAASGVRPEVALEATHWVFDMGTYSTSAQKRWGPTVRVGLRPSVGSRVSALAAISYASEGSFEPGVAGAAVELAVRFARIGESRRRFNGFITAAFGALHFDADRQESGRVACGPDCRFEGVTFRSGWRTMLSGGLGMDMPMSATVLLQPQLQILRPIGSGAAGPERNAGMLRLGLGLAWR